MVELTWAKICNAIAMTGLKQAPPTFLNMWVSAIRVATMEKVFNTKFSDGLMTGDLTKR